MVRKWAFFPKKTLAQLEQYAVDEGITTAELLRRIVAVWLKRQRNILRKEDKS